MVHKFNFVLDNIVVVHLFGQRGHKSMKWTIMFIFLLELYVEHASHRFINVNFWIDWFIIQLYLRYLVDEKHTEFILFYVKMKSEVRINENHFNGYINHPQQKKLLFPKTYDFHLIFHIIFWMVSNRKQRWSPPLVNLE